ncbi:hypothetical protein MRX96_012386 [Rhipicephalus microplus]
MSSISRGSGSITALYCLGYALTDNVCNTPRDRSLNPPGTSGITVGLLLAWSPPSTAKARTQFDVVCKKRRKEGYLVVDTISFVSLDKARPSEGLQHR